MSAIATSNDPLAGAPELIQGLVVILQDSCPKPLSKGEELSVASTAR